MYDVRCVVCGVERSAKFDDKVKAHLLSWPQGDIIDRFLALCAEEALLITHLNVLAIEMLMRKTCF